MQKFIIVCCLVLGSVMGGYVSAAQTASNSWQRLETFNMIVENHSPQDLYLKYLEDPVKVIPPGKNVTFRWDTSAPNWVIIEGVFQALGDFITLGTDAAFTEYCRYWAEFYCFLWGDGELYKNCSLVNLTASDPTVFSPWVTTSVNVSGETVIMWLKVYGH